jgi:L,D-peptidoglycan transpeptidase YkuD (ErfK/YbiS/YcfS/YnhG family)
VITARRTVSHSVARLAVAATLAASGALALAQTPRPDPDAALNDARQLVLVITESWDAVAGTLRRFERATSAAAWTEAGTRLPVVVGRTGLAWGRGVRTDPSRGPIKKEGDGKAPAGAYRLGASFGSAPQKPASWSVPYLPMGDSLECVDDVASAQYNRLVTKSQVARVDWKSSERMWEQRVYAWGLVVEHNTPVITPGGGSCIFLHTWSAPDRGTAGCTAMAEPNLLAVIGWLDPARTPLLVQLPRSEYERLKAAWRLP